MKLLIQATKVLFNFDRSQVFKDISVQEIPCFRFITKTILNSREDRRKQYIKTSLTPKVLQGCRNLKALQLGSLIYTYLHACSKASARASELNDKCSGSVRQTLNVTPSVCIF